MWAVHLLYTPFPLAVLNSPELSSFPLQNLGAHFKCLYRCKRCLKSLPRAWQLQQHAQRMFVNHTEYHCPVLSPTWALLPADDLVESKLVFHWAPYSFQFVDKVSQVLNLTNVFQNVPQEKAWLVIKTNCRPHLPTTLPVSVVVIKDWLCLPSASHQKS